MKFVLAMLLPMAMMGTTISATVDCGSGPIGGTGVSSASCSVPGSTASASVNFESVSNFGIDVAIEAPMDAPAGVPSASATVDIDLLVNVTGSTGTAFFVPCLQGSGDDIPPNVIATVSASIAGGRISSEGDNDAIETCVTRPNFPFFGQSFTFGQPFTADLALSSEASRVGGLGTATEGGVSLTGYEVFDTNLPVPMPIPATISVMILPEPNPALMMTLTLALSLVMPRLRARHRIR